MTDYTILDRRFGSLIIDHAKLERLWTGGRWLEGAAYFAAGRYLAFSDIPNDRIMRFDETSGVVSVFREPARNTNGHTVDQQGRLISCEHRDRGVSRTEHDGRMTMVRHTSTASASIRQMTWSLSQTAASGLQTRPTASTAPTKATRPSPRLRQPAEAGAHLRGQ